VAVSAADPPASGAEHGTWARLGLGMLHGPSQIYFQKNVVTGALILVAFFIADWRMGVLAILGCAGGILGGLLLRYRLSDAADGMLSFCGTLVGAAVYAALGRDEWWAWPLAFAGGVATGPVTWAIDALFTRTRLRAFGLPYTTAPFVIVATVIALSTARIPVRSGPAPLSTQPALAFLLSLFTNVAQVVLVGNAIAGAVILLGLFVANWKVGTAALLGSALGSLTAIAMGESWTDIASGIAGYSGVLTAIAIAVTFLAVSAASWLYALPWIVITAVVTLLMHRLGAETYTWPYILTTWAALIIAHFLRGGSKEDTLRRV
jgi:urea transporter